MTATTAESTPQRPTRGAPIAEPGRTRTRLLWVIVVILVVAALKWSMPVTLPFVIGLFLIALAWPLQVWLARRLPQGVAVILTSLAVLLVTAVIGGAFVWSVGAIAERGPELGDRLRALANEVTTWANQRGLPLPAGAANGGEYLMTLATGIVRDLYATVSALALAYVYLILGLLEVRDFKAKIERRLREQLGDELLDTTTVIAHRVRRYLVALTITCVVSGVVTGLFVWAVGLDFPIMWGIATFLLNYVLVIGPIVAVVPPTLYALLQFEGLSRPLTVFVGVGALQFFIGNFVDPKITGKVLSLSPIVVLFAVVLWGWIWGSFGALLAVPLTVALIIACHQFRGTQWLAALMTTWRKPRDGDDGRERE